MSTLTAADRCDRCGAQARHRFEFAAGERAPRQAAQGPPTPGNHRRLERPGWRVGVDDRYHCQWCDYRHPVAYFVERHEAECVARPGT